MAQPRRQGPEDSEVRTRFIDAAERILCEEGAAGISARAVAEKAGLKAQLLYYYFRTIDDLLGAVARRVNERRLARFEDVLASPEPLRALWDVSSDPANAALATELTGLATRREAIRAEIVDGAREFRQLQAEAAQRLMPMAEGADPRFSPGGMVMIAAALSRMLMAERGLGLTEGHDEALAIVEAVLERFEARAPLASAAAAEQVFSRT